MLQLFFCLAVFGECNIKYCPLAMFYQSNGNTNFGNWISSDSIVYFGNFPLTVLHSFLIQVFFLPIVSEENKNKQTNLFSIQNETVETTDIWFWIDQSEVQFEIKINLSQEIWRLLLLLLHLISLFFVLFWYLSIRWNVEFLWCIYFVSNRTYPKTLWRELGK